MNRDCAVETTDEVCMALSYLHGLLSIPLVIVTRRMASTCIERSPDIPERIGNTTIHPCSNLY